jgi:hypothetical protein
MEKRSESLFDTPDVQAALAAARRAIRRVLSEEQFSGRERTVLQLTNDAGNRFTKANYEQYLQDYAYLSGQQYAEFSKENYARVREMLEMKYGPRLPPQTGREAVAALGGASSTSTVPKKNSAEESARR